MGYQKVPGTNATFVIPKNKLKKFADLKTLASNTTGYRNKYFSTSRKDLQDADVVTFTPSGGSYQAFMKNDRNEAHFEGTVSTYKYERDASGKIVVDNEGNKKYDQNKIKTKDIYFDSDIKSIRNAAGTGSLNGPKHREATDTQDTRFQNSVVADKETTDKIIKGTVYGDDAIITELPDYPNDITKLP